MASSTGVMAPPPEFSWRAQTGSVRHAYLRRGRTVRPARALCGFEWIADPYLIPSRENCPACVTRADELVQAALRTPVTIGMGL